MKKIIFVIVLLICSFIIFFIILKNNSNSVNSVFLIRNYKNNLLYKEGNGFVYKIDKYAYILTNYHVISNNDDVYVVINNKEIKANILNYDEYDDIAIILVDKKYIDKEMKIGLLDNMLVMNNVNVISYNNINSGKLLTISRPFKIKYDNNIKMVDLLKINVKIDEGNSGSPVVDKNNNVIGMITMIDVNNSNYSFAIPINELMTKVKLLENYDYNRIDLGFEVLSNDNDIKGVIINKIYDDYYANISGLKVGDMVITLGYYNANDGGGSIYKIVNDNSLIEDSSNVFNLTNGFKAVRINNTDTNKLIFMPVAYYENDNASGDCTVLLANKSKKVVMFDTGATHSYTLIKQKLEENNITHIDYLIITHFHSDHFYN